MIEWAMTSSVLILVVLALRRVLMGRIISGFNTACGRWCWCACCYQ